jgi:hypothetical protein
MPRKERMRRTSDGLHDAKFLMTFMLCPYSRPLFLPYQKMSIDLSRLSSSSSRLQLHVTRSIVPLIYSYYLQIYRLFCQVILRSAITKGIFYKSNEHCLVASSGGKRLHLCDLRIFQLVIKYHSALVDSRNQMNPRRFAS